MRQLPMTHVLVTRLAATTAVAVVLLAGCHSRSTTASPASSAGTTSSAGTPSSSNTAPDSPSTSPDGRPSAKSPSTPTTALWPTYHRDGARTGYLAGAPPAHVMSIAWRVPLDGAIYASPIVTPYGVVAATENDSVYLLRAGRVVWRRHLGSPVALSSLPCGNIDPLGITGTPVFDAATGSLFVAAELAGPLRHSLFALDAHSGAVRWRRSLDYRGMVPGVEQQRGALAVAAGRVYVPFGGLAGDCGPFNGWIVGTGVDGNGQVAHRTPGREGGIWTPPGVTVVGTSLYASVGNGGATSTPYDDSDSIITLDTNLQLTALFAPSSWASDNAGDLDLGSNGPEPVGDDLMVVAGKRGVIYLVSRSNPGGVGHPLDSLAGCAAYGGSASVARTVYLPCKSGVQAVEVAAGNRLRRLWEARSNITGSPVVGGGVVWSIDPSGTLYQLAPRSGQVVRSLELSPMSRFATPALSYNGSSGYAYLGALDGTLYAVAGL